MRIGRYATDTLRPIRLGTVRVDDRYRDFELCPQGLNARLAKARKALDSFIDDIIDDHMQKKKMNNDSDEAQTETDMVDELLAFYSEEAKVSDSEDLQNAIRLTRYNIKAIIMVRTIQHILTSPVFV